MALPPVPQDLPVPCRGPGQRRRLNCLLYQRSCDVALGLPFNLWSAALLHADDRAAGRACSRANWCGWAAIRISISITRDLVEEQLGRAARRASRELEILRKPDSIFDYRIEDFAVTGYAPQGAIKAPIAV